MEIEEKMTYQPGVIRQHAYRYIFTVVLVGFVSCHSFVFAQKNTVNKEQNAVEKQISNVPEKVEIIPSARDEEIRQRLENIMNATQWYGKLDIRVDDGVVFLQGETKKEEYKEWAEALSRKTQDVVAVVNKIQIKGASAWDIRQQVTTVLREQWQGLVRALPFLALSLLVLIITWLVAKLVSASTRKSLHYRKLHPLLTDVIARGVALFCFLIGFYIVLQTMGWTTIALTLLGGTGVLGIILGIAFRDITENLLASVLLSIQSPFDNGDLVEIADVTGYVEKLTIRVTILITLTGQVVQIPNATVYKSNIFNYTSSPNRREEFIIGIGYDESVSFAQEIALKVLIEHPAILSKPEPLILVSELTPETVNLRILFWFNGNEYNWQKVKSSAIRLVKRAFQENDIFMPGREMVLSFEDKLPVQLLREKDKAPAKRKVKEEKESDSVSTHAEGELRNEASDIQQQARHSDAVEKEADLLQSSRDSG
ncbi:mechanosensitive ion channel domain-containing protein [Legionella israelensis]|uniref:Small-conductance mechanosensitive channel n=1 Tax=Legionella israelensis TaxID=454 RepID=A0A0W0V894_9GAMM|nr:mechanosensitive ion channel domain-containing protein [Legionella israelensis]KTD15865.1 mechanosensitive ion channel MscS [Legionella israelensis]QBS09190.1 mechanosensitive ion channel [Legionella israelensis]SCY22819.1 Small-conductance mechanosensitive channel [Legionella israelensis DSM 19235]STX58927.1 mechanosensitive ion channel MscS [Legionella israelensis]